MLEAVFNNIIVKPREEKESTYGSILVPDLGIENVFRGTIVSIGEGCYSETGNFVPTILKKGQKVVIPISGTEIIEDDGYAYWICPENHVLAIMHC